MEILKYLLLAVVQGLTETIPVSSSGHLMIIKKLISLDVDFNTIAILTNFGSLIAISDNILRLISTPAFVNPSINLE